jgi:antitoxin (DNA-binding transcriptional repressor) of toxin-antitoxin stability system
MTATLEQTQSNLLKRVNLVQPGEEVVITSQGRVGATFPFRQEWT